MTLDTAPQPGASPARSARSTELFHEQREHLLVRTDRLFAVLIGLQWIGGILAAAFLSPQTWAGTTSTVHAHLWAALLLGAGITLPPIYLVLTRPGAPVTRYTIAVCQALWSALLVHLTGGRIETHFHIFGSLAFLAVYRDRKVLITCASIVVVDHLLRGVFWPQSVYGVLTAPIWRSLEHGGWVVFEMTFLFVAIRQSIKEMWGIADRQARMEEINQDIEQRVQERTHELELMAARTSAILETAADGIITIDHDGIVQSLNPAAERIFGQQPEDVLGKNVSMLMPAPFADAHDGYIARYLETSEKKVIDVGREVVGLRKDGSTFPLDLSVSESRGGVFTGIVRDISERKVVDRMKTEFISTVSHELRTPLTSIRGSLGLLTGGVAGELPEKSLSLVNIALSNCERLVRLVNDILDIEKIESGKMQFSMERLDMGSAVDTAVATNEAFAEQHGVSLRVRNETPGAASFADGDRIQQVLTNLISNAVKFSPEAETVDVTVRHSGRVVRVEVIDRGPGIPEEFRARIFGKFAQADASDTRQKQGTGLGLNISKAIVEKHGGRIGFDTELGTGTTFYFELPIASVPEAVQENPATTPGEPDSRPRILVCEDDPDIAKLIGLMLEHRGFSVDQVASPDEARARLATECYAAMTLDLMFPSGSGLDFIRELRQSEETRHLPVVVVSAKAEQGRVELNGDAVGVVDWLEKPIDEDRLLSIISASVQDIPESFRILHVEDDSDLSFVVRGILDPIAEVVHAPNLAAARLLLDDADFDLALLDMDLPDGSGLSLVPLLNQRPRPIPAVIFSAAEVREDVAERVAATLVKSRTTNTELSETVETLIRAAVTST